MKQILLMLSIFSLVMMAACQPAGPSEPAGEVAVDEEAAATEEPAAETTAEQIQKDLDTSALDEIAEDADLLILE